MNQPQISVDDVLKILGQKEVDLRYYQSRLLEAQQEIHNLQTALNDRQEHAAD